MALAIKRENLEAEVTSAEDVDSVGATMSSTSLAAVSPVRPRAHSGEE